MRNSFDPEVAWAAGFFEGEGTITSSGTRLVVRLNNTDPEPVYCFAFDAILLEASKAEQPY